MRRSIAVLASGGLAAAVLAPAAALVPVAGAALPPVDTAKTERPSGPNPYLAIVPNPDAADYAGWRDYLAARGDAKAVQRERAATPYEQTLPALAPIDFQESEAAGERGGNDEPATADEVRRFGTDANPKALLRGSLSSEDVPTDPVAANAEDDGAIPLAGETGIGSSRDGIRTTARIGDGPHGSAGSGSGDFDFYAVDAIVGESLTIDTNTPTGNLDTMVVVWNSDGEAVAFNDDDDVSLDSFLQYAFEEEGAYTVMVSGFPNLPADPFDSGSGDGAGTEGPYELRITVGEVDRDFYAVQLRAGDVLGTSVEGSASLLALYDPNGVRVQGSMQDASFIYPAETPLPGGGNAVAEHVADETGRHYVAVSQGDGEYAVTTEAYRPRLESDPPVQTIYLDFDGARIQTAIWGGPGVRTLSPLSDFLGRWGLDDGDLDAVIDAVVAETRENVRRDLAASGVNDDFRVRILNSRDHGDRWGGANVSRVIVGGTIDQLGIPTIGIAQSIDPGNFATQESAVVLLDVLSDPTDEFGDASLNFYLRPRSDTVAFVGQAVGNVVSHEAGHFFGDWHVDQFNAQANLMDQGGNFALLYGVGPDGVGGTADDTDVDFGEDVFNPNEGFTGIEDTLSRLAVVLTR